MDLRDAFSEVGTELRTVVTLNGMKSEEGFSLSSLKEINRILGVRPGIRSRVRPPRIHIETGEDIHPRSVGFHEMNSIDLDQITWF